MIHSVKINFDKKALLIFLYFSLIMISCSATNQQAEKEAVSLVTDTLGYMEYDKGTWFVPESYKKNLADYLTVQAANSPEKDLVIFVQNMDNHSVMWQQTASGKLINNEKLIELAKLVPLVKKVEFTWHLQPFSIKIPALFESKELKTYYGATGSFNFIDSALDKKEQKNYRVVSLEAVD